MSVSPTMRPGIKADLLDLSRRLYRLERRTGGGGSGATGPAGPTGATGPAGATGATGGGGGSSVYGNSEFISASGSGLVTVTHGIGTTPSQVIIQITGNPTSTYAVQNVNRNSTTFSFRVRDAATGTNVTSGTNIQFDWIAKV